MRGKFKRNRSQEILGLLKDHGPLTIEMLNRMTEPTMPKVNLRQSLKVLRDKELIESTCFGPHQVFYYVSQSRPKRERIANVAGQPAEVLKQPLLRRAEWIHNGWCEYWALQVKRAFPDAKITREHDIGSDDLAKRLLLITDRDDDLLPDFLVVFPKGQTGEHVSIAFEIERTRKSDKRLMRKFRKYLNRTRLDGLIYVCDTGRLSETIRALYSEKLIANATRVNHYGENFFLFSDSITAGRDPITRLFNSQGKQASLTDWVIQLRTSKQANRRDAVFK